jgi:ABC-2 type transport system ATP-binding protein
MPEDSNVPAGENPKVTGRAQRRNRMIVFEVLARALPKPSVSKDAPRRKVKAEGEVVEVKDLRKHYEPDIRAVDGISFSIMPGQVFSLLGANGAGKTTTIEIMEGLRDPTSGTVNILGVNIAKDYDQIRKRVGILPQNFEPFDMLKPWEAVVYWANLFRTPITRKDAEKLLARLGLGHRSDVVSKGLSGGEKRKLGIALALVNEPELLFLDEPTTGLDPKARRDLWAVIRQIKETGTTVVLTTHYLDEAEKLSDNVAIMNKGRIIATGSPDELIGRYGSGTVIVLVGAGMETLAELKKRGMNGMKENGNVLVPVSNPAQMRTTFEKISSLEIDFKDIYTRRQNLEDVFLNLVGSKMDDGELRT